VLRLGQRLLYHTTLHPPWSNDLSLVDRPPTTIYLIFQEETTSPSAILEHANRGRGRLDHVHTLPILHDSSWGNRRKHTEGS
ncbi:hypothetical protein LTR40_011872, partial [Exophiala xenobiotica]